MGHPNLTRAERFWLKVFKTETCWLWFGATTLGYGRFVWDDLNGERFYGMAHRFSYELAKGPISPGLQLDHLCRVRHCVNPDHLEPVTNKVNHERGHHPRRNECYRGHPYTSLTPEGWNYCRACAKVRRDRHYGKKRRMRTIELVGTGDEGG